MTGKDYPARKEHRAGTAGDAGQRNSDTQRRMARDAQRLRAPGAQRLKARGARRMAHTRCASDCVKDKKAAESKDPATLSLEN